MTQMNAPVLQISIKKMEFVFIISE
jgi:hypothetical protein